MGNEASREERLISSINTLSKNPSRWPSVVEEFKKNVPKGTPLRCNDKRVFEVMLNVLKDEQSKKTNVLPLLEAFERLLFAKGLFKAVSANKTNMIPFLQCLSDENLKIVYTGLLVLKQMVDPLCPPLKHNSYEITNKAMFEHANGFEALSKLIVKFAYTEKVDIVIAAMDILYTFLVTRYDTTSFDAKQKMVHLFLPHHEVFQDLSRNNVPSLRLIACNVFVALIKESDHETYRKLQEDARDHGALLWQFRYAIMPHTSPDNYTDGDKSEQRFVSRELFARLCDGNTKSIELLGRMVPSRFVDRLLPDDDDDESEKESRKKKHVKKIVDQDGKIIKMNKTEKAIAEKQVKNVVNWSETSLLWVQLFEDLETDFDQPDVIWNETTRKELRSIIEAEIEDLDMLRMYKRHIVTWDSEGYEINYPSLRGEQKIDRYYMRTLVPELELKKSPFEINDPCNLLRCIYDRCVVEDQEKAKLMYLKAIAGLVERYDVIVNEDVPMHYLVWLLSPEHFNEGWREIIIRMLHTLFKYHKKAKEFVDAGGIRALVYHLCFVHTLIIKRKRSSEAGTEGEVQNSEAPYELDTPSLTLDILALLEMLTVFPRLCRRLSYPTTLQYIVQVLLGGHPALSSQTTVLLSTVVDSNPKIVPNLHKTGVFVFLMSTLGDSVSDAAARFLYAYHMQTTGEGEERQSILKKFFPDSMIRLLIKGGPQKFAMTLEKDVETPELIWNRSLRQTLITTVNQYLERFKSTLKKNPHAVFEYEDPPIVRYPELESELCINGVYLRVFNKVDDFPLREPEAFLSDAVINMNTTTDDKNLQLLLAAQTTLFRLIPDLNGFRSYDGFVTLINILRRDVETVDLSHQAAELLLCLVTKDEREDTSLRADQAVQRCVEMKGVEVVSSLLFDCVRNRDQANQSLVNKLIKIIAALLRSETAQQIVYENNFMMRHIVALFKDQTMAATPEIAVSALSVVLEYSKSHMLQEHLVQYGVLLYLTRMAVIGRHEKLMSANFGTKISEMSAECLAHMMQSQRGDSTLIDQVLAILLTPGLYIQLKNPQQFLKHARGNVSTPILIYNDTLRFELETFLHKEISALELNGLQWRADQFTFQYPSLAKEVQVDGVFLRIYNENPTFQLPQPHNFVISLCDSLAEDAVWIKRPDAPSNADAARAYAAPLCKAQALFNLLSQHGELIEPFSQYQGLPAILDIIHTFHLPLKFCMVNLLSVLSKHKETIPFAQDLFTALHAVMAVKTERVTPPVSVVLTIFEDCVRRASYAVPKIIDGGILVTILGVFCFPKKYSPETRIRAARVIGWVGKDQLFGKQACALLKVIFVNEFERAIERACDRPQELVDFYDKNHDSPVIIWNDRTRHELCQMLESEMRKIEKHFIRNPRTRFMWDYTALEDRYHRPSLEEELCVGGIYIRNFIHTPYFQIDVDKFLQNVFAALEHELEFFTTHRGSDIVQRTYGNLRMMWEAVYALLSNNNNYITHPIITQQLSFIFVSLREDVEEKLASVIIKVLVAAMQHPANVKVVEKEDYIKNIIILYRIHKGCTGGLLTLIHDCIRQRSGIAAQCRAFGGVLIILETLLTSPDTHNRLQAAKLLCLLCTDRSFGPAMVDYVCVFLTSKFEDVFNLQPEKFLLYFDGDHFDEAWERYWNADVRHQLRRVVTNQVNIVTKNLDGWSLSRGEIVDLSILQSVYYESHRVAMDYPPSKRDKRQAAGSVAALGLEDDPELRRNMSMSHLLGPSPVPKYHDDGVVMGSRSAPRSSPISISGSDASRLGTYGRSY